jgi:aspartate/methionine/tyrosine aminotransferase
LRFSRRLRWSLEPNAMARLTESERGRYVDLTITNPTAVGLAYPSSILRALEHPGGLSYRPEAKGMREAREAVCGYYGELGSVVDPDQVVLTSSTSEAYSYVLKLLADPGESLLTPVPSYPLFEFLAGMELVETQSYRLAYGDRWRVVGTAGTASEARAVVAVNPNNPTGSYLDEADWLTVGRFCEESGAALIADEVFYDYVLEADSRRLAMGNRDRLTFTLSGLSKVAALPQMKLGWIVVTGEGWEEALERLELIADTYLPVATPVQLALPVLLESRFEFQSQLRYRMQRNLARLREAFGSRVLRCEGGWSAIVRLDEWEDDEQVALRLLRDQGVLTQPGYFFDLPEASLVVSLIVDAVRFDEGVERWRRAD